MPSIIANKSQERARFAYSEILKVINSISPDASEDDKRKQKEINDKFKSHIKDIPMMIRTNGLAAAFAFVFSKKDDGYKHIERITKDWLKGTAPGDEPARDMILDINEPFHQRLIRCTPEEYRRCTREIMSLYTWLKRYADGLIIDN
jgi:CRISPR-associated protein Cmr5